MIGEEAGQSGLERNKEFPPDSTMLHRLQPFTTLQPAESSASISQKSDSSPKKKTDDALSAGDALNRHDLQS